MFSVLLFLISASLSTSACPSLSEPQKSCPSALLALQHLIDCEEEGRGYVSVVWCA